MIICINVLLKERKKKGREERKKEGRIKCPKTAIPPSKLEAATYFTLVFLSGKLLKYIQLPDIFINTCLRNVHMLGIQ